MRTNPGKKVTIYDIPDLVNSAHSYAFTHASIVSGFKNTDIYPYNSNIFTDLDFAPSEVTDRQDPAFSYRHTLTGKFLQTHPHEML